MNMKMDADNGYVSAGYLNNTGDFLRKVKQHSYQLMDFEAADTVLDVGCGPGIDTVAMASLPGFVGRVHGVDHDPEFLNVADKLVKDKGLSSRVVHSQADCFNLPFAGQSIQACRCERVFQHLSDPEQALKEMVRVTKKGGKIVVVDTDWGSLIINSDEPLIEAKLAQVRADKIIANAHAGRQLLGLFNRCGLQDIKVEVVPLWISDLAFTREATILDRVELVALEEKAILQTDLDRWHKSLAQKEESGELFSSMVQLVVSGEKG